VTLRPLDTPCPACGEELLINGTRVICRECHWTRDATPKERRAHLAEDRKPRNV